jgi:hypothetical protein
MATGDSFQSLVDKIKGTAFEIPDPDQFYRARLMYMDGKPGWSLEMAEALGLLKMPMGTIGGCLGCYFYGAVTFWIVRAIFKETENKKVVFVSDTEINIEMDADRGWLGQPDAAENLAAAIYEFQRNSAAEVVIVQAVTASHSTMVSFRRNGNKISVLWVDSYGINANAIIASEAIKAHLATNGPREFSYEVERPACIAGPQLFEQLGPLKEPGGYCMAWSALMIIFTAATDGTRPEEVFRELGGMLKNNPAHMANFIRVVTRNAARLVQERLGLTEKECAIMPCCEKETYCSPITDA